MYATETADGAILGPHIWPLQTLLRIIYQSCRPEGQARTLGALGMKGGLGEGQVKTACSSAEELRAGAPHFLLAPLY